MDPKDALPWINLGNLLQFNLNRDEEAAEARKAAAGALRESLAKAPDDPWSLLRLGELCMGYLGSLEKAETCYGRYLERHPDAEQPLQNLVWLRRDVRGQPAEAAPLLDRLASLPARDAEDLYHLQRAVSGLYDSAWELARGEFAAALELAELLCRGFCWHPDESWR